MELLLLGMVAGIGFASFALWQKARKEEDQAAAQRRKRLSAPVDRTPTTIQVGDVVQHLGSDYVVEGVMTLSEDGRGARLYRMFEDGGESFLYAKTGTADPLLLKPAPELSLADLGGAPPETLTHARASFRQTARVQASVIRVGQLGARKATDRVHLYEYAGPGPSRLLLLDWGERVEAFAGERVAAHSLEILPSR
jgi:hypothetical protein